MGTVGQRRRLRRLTVIIAVCGLTVARPIRADPGSSVGAGWAGLIVRRRMLMLIGGIAVLGVLAIPSTQIRLGLPSGASQPAGNTQRQACDLTARGFGVGFKGVLLIVAQDLRRPPDTPAGRGPHQAAWRRDLHEAFSASVRFLVPGPWPARPAVRTPAALM